VSHQLEAKCACLGHAQHNLQHARGIVRGSAGKLAERLVSCVVVERGQADWNVEFADVLVTDLDEKYKNNTRANSIPHAEFVGMPGPKIRLSSVDGTPVTGQLADARDPPPSPGHTNCSPRISITSLETDQTNKSDPPSPITAVATPAVTPSTHIPPILQPQSLERIARHNRGTPLHQNVYQIFRSDSSSSVSE